jgi:hypothetical protein
MEERMKPVSTSLVLAALLFLSASVQSARIAAAQNGDTVSSLESLRERLISGSDTDRTALAGALQLNIPKWTRVGAANDLPCILFDSVQASLGTLDRAGNQAVVIIYSRNCEYTYLAAFERTPEGTWKRLDTAPLWSKLGEPQISLVSLIDDGNKEIVAAHRTVDTGTGIVQTDLTIFKLFSGRLQVILDSPEHVVYALAPGPKGTGAADQTQESAFTFVPSLRDEPKTSSTQIVEKRVIGSGTIRQTQWWLYVWIPEVRRFQAIRTSARVILLP